MNRKQWRKNNKEKLNLDRNNIKEGTSFFYKSETKYKPNKFLSIIVSVVIIITAVGILAFPLTLAYGLEAINYIDFKIHEKERVQELIEYGRYDNSDVTSGVDSMTVYFDTMSSTWDTINYASEKELVDIAASYAKSSGNLKGYEIATASRSGHQVNFYKNMNLIYTIKFQAD
jgi:hypothetical protein